MRNRRSFLAVASILAAFALGCGDDGGTSLSAPELSAPAPLPEGGMAITITGTKGAQSFFPATASVELGQIVEWRNMHNDLHNLVEDFGRFETGDIKPGTTSRTLRMDVAGTYVYRCIEHPKMVGTIVVTP